nr:hypothetical protein [Tanacetum cinerariifolium]
MSTPQDIYHAGSENRPPMLNNEKRMILEPGDADREVPINETFHEQTDDELTKKELKQIRCYNYRGLGHLARNYTVRPRRIDVAYLQLQTKEFDLMVAAANLDEIKEVNANCNLMDNL